MKAAFESQRAMVVAATLCKPPSQAELKVLRCSGEGLSLLLQILIEGTVAAIASVEQVVFENHAPPLFLKKN